MKLNINQQIKSASLLLLRLLLCVGTIMTTTCLGLSFGDSMTIYRIYALGESGQKELANRIRALLGGDSAVMTAHCMCASDPNRTAYVYVSVPRSLVGKDNKIHFEKLKTRIVRIKDHLTKMAASYGGCAGEPDLEVYTGPGEQKHIVTGQATSEISAELVPQKPPENASLSERDIELACGEECFPEIRDGYNSLWRACFEQCMKRGPSERTRRRMRELDEFRRSQQQRLDDMEKCVARCGQRDYTDSNYIECENRCGDRFLK